MKKNVVFLLFSIQSLVALSTLSELEQIAKKHEEFPKNNAETWHTPNYNALYKALGPNFFNRLLGKKNPIVKAFEELLINLGDQRHRKTNGGKHIMHLVAPAGSEFYICGDISGGFHSLIRTLSFLKEQAIIDDVLTIIKPEVYLVFNGNSVNGGPYNIETLTTILLLIKQNPERVYYLKGKQETNDYWTNLNFKHELKLRAGSLFQTVIPFHKAISTFFNTLPSALYINTPENLQSYIRISPSGRDSIIINESIVVQNISKKAPEGAHVISLQRKKKTAQADMLPDIISIIKSEDLIKKHEAKKGLAQTDQNLGSTAWVVLSTPIESYKKLLKFSYDAFAVLTLANPLSASSISLYNRKFDSDESFSKKQSFNIQTGITLDRKDHKNGMGHFIIGSSMALLQGVPIMGQQTKRGMSVRLDVQNKKGGIGNALLHSIVYNDNYTPHISRKNIDTLLTRDNAELILLPVGSPTLASYLDYIKDGKATVLFPITGGPQFRDPSLKGIVHYRGTYADEVRALIDYMVTEGAAKKFVFFYQNDAYGKGPLEAAHTELKRKGITTWTDVPYQRNSIDYKKQANKIKETQPDAIGFFSTGQATRELIRQIGIDFLTNKQLFGISFLGEASFRRFMKKHGLKVLLGAVVPNPNTSDLEIVKQYRAAMDAQNYPYDIFSLEAYIATSILLNVMQQITPPITKEKILKKIEQLKDYDFKGLTLTFNPERRDLAQYIWLESGKDQEWVKKKIKKNDLKKKGSDARSINTSGSKQFSQKPTSTPS